MKIRRSIQKTKVLKEPLVEEEDRNNDNEINTQNEYGNGMDSALVKYNDKIEPSETTRYAKKGGKGQKIQKHNIIFIDSLQDHNIGLILILTGLNTIL